jgi:hypothetical protein
MSPVMPNQHIIYIESISKEESKRKDSYGRRKGYWWLVLGYNK